MANICDPRYPPEIDFYFETKCGRIFGWSAPDMESLFLQAHERGFEVTFIQTMEERNAPERELKESA